MLWETVINISSESNIQKENFWSGVKVWIERPHVVNTKVLIAELLESWKEMVVNESILEYFSIGNFCQQSLIEMFKCNDQFGNSGDENETTKKLFFLRKLHPKHFRVFSEVLDVVIIDYLEDSVSFYPNVEDVKKSPLIPNFPYKFKLLGDKILLEIPQMLNKDLQAESIKWLSHKIMPKILKWCLEIPKHPIVPSLQLVSAKDYNKNLYYLKSKYAKHFLQIWPTYNTTDPKKFVYEDISIAAYLITLWSEEREKLGLSKKQTYVDLGCGNGLLDHILSSEGHEGIGIDLRRRKIWDAYGPETNLMETVIQPNDEQLYPKYDWIIGNHADELTPWIPVIAARSSYNMKVFLLPCCFYTFDGKYVRPCAEITQYQSYLDFIKTLCSAMGFNAQFDKLRIPSTKRTCIVCTSRNYKEEDECSFDLTRREFIHNHSKKPFNAFNSNLNANAAISARSIPSTKKWIADFTPRDKIEKVQNCTNLEKQIKENIISCIVNELLSTENYVTIMKEDSTIRWNQGGSLKLKDLGSILSPDILRNLKAQRGGFQTFLRNHAHIFQVQNNVIQLRMPAKKESYDKELSVRQKKCFFYFNHPQSCPSSTEDCIFSHLTLV